MAAQIVRIRAEGFERLALILAILVGVAIVVVGVGTTVIAGLRELRPLPDTRATVPLLEWVGGALLALAARLVVSGGWLAATLIGLAFLVATGWAYMYGTAVLAGRLFGLSFGWGLAAAAGIFFVACLVGGAIWGWRSAAPDPSGETRPPR